MPYGDPWPWWWNTYAPPLNTTTYYGWCREHGQYQSYRPGCPYCPVPTATAPAVIVQPIWAGPLPPPVCTGSAHPPTDGYYSYGTGTCGICRRVVAIGPDGRCVTHSYEPPTEAPPSESASAYRASRGTRANTNSEGA